MAVEEDITRLLQAEEAEEVEAERSGSKKNRSSQGSHKPPRKHRIPTATTGEDPTHHHPTAHQATQTPREVREGKKGMASP
ncbi:unnamed protein product [Linum trigynum]|uniref:Uncharacterized protein n=1 Tax=Linum trigynum TaxID=586398 RepID=A0AAV2EN87_9ROSI